MTPEDWHKVKEVLQTALELEPGARTDFLDVACPRGNGLRAEVESLLESHEQDEAFLERPAAVDAADLVLGPAPAARIGRRLGPYELLEEIGQGGMGEVYRAVRVDGMYDQQVAIKVIRSGLGTEFFVSRFKNERQILAGLEHPNIASLRDGGVTEEGLPYVVLEFVAGEPIDQYCAHHNLSIAERLKLFRTVCSAVQYAHQNLVVHRDLKPGNILVTEDGVPKLLDFGIAKILDPQQSGDAADQTLTMMRIMTPDFASPEQVRGAVITTSSDIYSLGVILYVLLTGRRPYRVSSSAPHEIVKAICDTDPEKPSTAATRHQKSQNAVRSDSDSKAAKGAEPDLQRKRLLRALSGDLDNIVLKALRKEPSRRYATVEQFSEDIRRHLEHLPVIASKDTPGYLASKFILRHKTGVAASAVVAMTLIAALVITIREARIARAERVRAERRFNDVRALANSLIFEVHDSIRSIPGTTAARKLILQRAQEYLDGLAAESSPDPSLRRELAAAYGRLASVLGDPLYANLGNSQQALRNYQRAIGLREEVAATLQSPDSQRELAQSYLDPVGLLENMGQRQTSQSYNEKALAILQPLTAANPGDKYIQYALAKALERNAGGLEDLGKWADAAATHEKALAIYQQLLEADPKNVRYLGEVAFGHKHVGGALIMQKQFLPALDHYRMAQAIEEARLKADPGNADERYAITYTYSDIGYILAAQGNLDAALESYRKSVEIRSQLAAADPKDVRARRGLANNYENMAGLLLDQRNLPQALEYYKRVFTIRQELSGNDLTNKRKIVEQAAARADIASAYFQSAFWKGTDHARRAALCRKGESWAAQALPGLEQYKDQLLGNEPHFIAQVQDGAQRCRQYDRPAP